MRPRLVPRSEIIPFRIILFAGRTACPQQFHFSCGGSDSQHKLSESGVVLRAWLDLFQEARGVGKRFRRFGEPFSPDGG